MNMRTGPMVPSEHAMEGGQAAPQAARAPQQPLNLDAAIFKDVQVSLRVKLGETSLTIEDLLSMKSGALLKLDRMLHEPVDLYLNEALVGRGEIVAIEDCFGVRVTELGPR